MNSLRLGPMVTRFGGKGALVHPYPRLSLGGLSFWSWTSAGDFSLVAYHPRSSITWLWFVHITRRPGRGYAATFSREEINRMASLHRDGNPHAPRPRWFHRFWQPASLRRGQWTDNLRLPFGFTAKIGHQSRMTRKPAAS